MLSACFSHPRAHRQGGGGNAEIPRLPRLVLQGLLSLIQRQGHSWEPSVAFSEFFLLSNVWEFKSQSSSFLVSRPMAWPISHVPTPSLPQRTVHEIQLPGSNRVPPNSTPHLRARFENGGEIRWKEVPVHHSRLLEDIIKRRLVSLKKQLTCTEHKTAGLGQDANAKLSLARRKWMLVTWQLGCKCQLFPD